MVEINRCTRTNFCVDCDDPDCLLAGNIEADCPKWKCDNPSMDCETCEFLKEYKKGGDGMRPIDADWLLDVVENIIDWDTERDKNRIIHQVRELTPTIDTEPKKGTWIDTGDMEETYGNVSKCSVCGAIDYEANFCPNCGADMREVTT